MVLVALAYWAVFALAAPLCLGLVPSLRTRPRKEQLGAFIRVPSLVNCLVRGGGVVVAGSLTRGFSQLVTALGSHLLFDPALVADRLHGRSPGGDLISLLAAGYFLFDVTHACFDYQGLAFLMHAAFCLCIFTAAIQPFCQYYAVVFLFFEVSTVRGGSGGVGCALGPSDLRTKIFLNVMWYIKYVFDVSESHVLYRAVAALFAVSFFLARIAMGNIMRCVLEEGGGIARVTPLQLVLLARPHRISGHFAPACHARQRVLVPRGQRGALQPQCVLVLAHCVGGAAGQQLLARRAGCGGGGQKEALIDRMRWGGVRAFARVRCAAVRSVLVRCVAFDPLATPRRAVFSP